MKIAFISDIHGNADALESVLNDISKRNIDKIYVLGDLCFRGIGPQRSLDLVRSFNTEVIKGNADEWVVRGIKKGEVPDHAFEMMTCERNWTYSHLNKEGIEYLQSLPTNLNIECGGTRIHLFHATPDSLFEEVQPFESDEILCEKIITNDADIFIYGHIHKPYIRFMNGKCIVNTGSVGMPFDGNNRPSYAMLDLNSDHYNVSIVRVEYDLNNVVSKLSDSDYPNPDFIMSVLLTS
ncbi:MAG: metallophosphoesterase family protein [Heyndrickxia sp.]